VSFMDPDYRQALSEAQRKHDADCAKLGHTFTSIDVCVRCGRKDTRPRIVATFIGQRAVFRPDRNTITIEVKSVDSMGAVRWDAQAEHGGPLVAFLAYGTKEAP
jgi:hypothetical protein